MAAQLNCLLMVAMLTVFRRTSATCFDSEQASVMTYNHLTQDDVLGQANPAMDVDDEGTVTAAG